MGGWLRHRPGGVDLRSERPGITGATSPSMSWDPWPPPGRASGRGYAGVYTDRRKRPLGVTAARMQSAPFGEAHTQSAPFRDVAVASLVQNALFRESDTPRVRLLVTSR